MKSVTIITLLVISLTMPKTKAQEMDVNDLSAYTPKSQVQSSTDCWAYASSYIAINTFLNNKQKRNATPAEEFSFKHISKLRDKVSDKEIRDWTKKVYPDCEGEIGNLDRSLFMLSTYGTIPQNLADKEKIKSIDQYKKLIQGAKVVAKITNIKEILNPCNYSNTISKKIGLIKAALNNGNTIVCAIEQNDPDHGCDPKFIKSNTGSEPPQENHIVNIVGVDRSSQYLHIRNNYETTCTFWVSASDFLSVTSWAYTFDVVVIRK